MAANYLYQRLNQAMDSLIGSGTVQERVGYAGVHLAIAADDERFVPADVRGDWNAVRAWLGQGQGGVKDNAKRLTTEEAERLAEKIFNCFRGVTRQYAAELSGLDASKFDLMV